MNVFEGLRFNVRVGLFARRQRMLGIRPLLIRCASKGRFTTYKVRGSKSSWEYRVESWDIYRCQDSAKPMPLRPPKRIAVNASLTKGKGVGFSDALMARTVWSCLALMQRIFG
jgi:hypothetical protein